MYALAHAHTLRKQTRFSSSQTGRMPPTAAHGVVDDPIRDSCFLRNPFATHKHVAHWCFDYVRLVVFVILVGNFRKRECHALLVCVCVFAADALKRLVWAPLNPDEWRRRLAALLDAIAWRAIINGLRRHTKPFVIRTKMNGAGGWWKHKHPLERTHAAGLCVRVFVLHILCCAWTGVLVVCVDWFCRAGNRKSILGWCNRI